MPRSRSDIDLPAASAAATDAGVYATALCGEQVELLAARALHWPRERTVFVADVHLGKAAAFRAGGVPLPRGSTAADLARLARVLQQTGARRLVVLGDFLHARGGPRERARPRVPRLARHARRHRRRPRARQSRRRAPATRRRTGA